LPALSDAGVALGITNYWAIVSGSYKDYISGMDLTTTGGVTLVADRLGTDSTGAFLTDGTTGYASAPSGVYFPGASFSMTLWVKLVSQSITMFDFAVGNSNDNIHFVTNYAGACTSNTFLALFSGSMSSNVCQPSDFTVGVWTHVAITYDYSAATAKLYLNGAESVSAGSQKLISSVTRTSNYFGHDTYSNFGNWQFDEIKIHSRVLTAAEISYEYSSVNTYITFV
jgi:hypothetical protein